MVLVSNYCCCWTRIHSLIVSILPPAYQSISNSDATVVHAHVHSRVQTDEGTRRKPGLKPSPANRQPCMHPYHVQRGLAADWRSSSSSRIVDSSAEW